MGRETKAALKTFRRLISCPKTQAPYRVTIDAQKQDDVNHPAHYKSASGIESIDIIEAFSLGFCLGNCIKYILRAGKKDPSKTIEDLEKARWYIDRHIKGLQK